MRTGGLRTGTRAASHGENSSSGLLISACRMAQFINPGHLGWINTESEALPGDPDPILTDPARIACVSVYLCICSVQTGCIPRQLLCRFDVDSTEDSVPADHRGNAGNSHGCSWDDAGTSNTRNSLLFYINAFLHLLQPVAFSISFLFFLFLCRHSEPWIALLSAALLFTHSLSLFFNLSFSLIPGPTS